MPRKQPSYFEQAMRNTAVMNGLERVARRKADAAQSITDAEGGEALIRMRSGRRPGGRLFVDITSDRPDEEYGTENKKRIRALGRAAREG